MRTQDYDYLIVFPLNKFCVFYRIQSNGGSEIRALNAFQNKSKIRTFNLFSKPG